MSLVRVDAQLVLTGDAYDAATARPVLELLERDPVLAPQRWSAEPGLRDRYDRGALLTALAAHADDLAPEIHRITQPCAYNATWFGSAVLSTLIIETRRPHDTAEVELFFGAMSRLAAELPTEWGHVTPVFDGAPPGTAREETNNFTHLGYYETYGPARVYPRTFFGTRIVNLMQPEVAESLRRQGIFRQLANGTLQLDLEANPWTADPRTLKQSQQAAHEKLFPTGIFCDESDEVDTLPGPNWQPPQKRPA
jgi:hypothetical protein